MISSHVRMWQLDVAIWCLHGRGSLTEHEGQSCKHDHSLVDSVFSRCGEKYSECPPYICHWEVVEVDRQDRLGREREQIIALQESQTNINGGSSASQDGQQTAVSTILRYLSLLSLYPLTSFGKDRILPCASKESYQCVIFGHPKGKVL